MWHLAHFVSINIQSYFTTHSCSRGGGYASDRTIGGKSPSVPGVHGTYGMPPGFSYSPARLGVMQYRLPARSRHRAAPPSGVGRSARREPRCRRGSRGVAAARSGAAAPPRPDREPQRRRGRSVEAAGSRGGGAELFR